MCEHMCMYKHTHINIPSWIQARGDYLTERLYLSRFRVYNLNKRFEKS